MLSYNALTLVLGTRVITKFEESCIHGGLPAYGDCEGEGVGMYTVLIRYQGCSHCINPTKLVMENHP
jgi:hypothetical protein